MPLEKLNLKKLFFYYKQCGYLEKLRLDPKPVCLYSTVQINSYRDLNHEKLIFKVKPAQ